MKKEDTPPQLSDIAVEDRRYFLTETVTIKGREANSIEGRKLYLCVDGYKCSLKNI